MDSFTLNIEDIDFFTVENSNEKVYDIEVENNHNFFLYAKEKDILVHNSGKSFEVGRFAVLLSYYPNERILYTRQTMTSAQVSIIPEIQEKINYIDKAHEFQSVNNKIINTFSKNEIIFKGLQTSSGDQTANLKSLTNVTCWVLDEAEELTDEDKFDKIDFSFRKKVLKQG